MKNLSYFLILALVFLMSCTKESPLPIAQESQNALRSGDDGADNEQFRPFKGRADLQNTAGAVTRCFDLNPALSTVSLEGSGVMTHLGRMTVAITQCVDRTGAIQSPLVITNAEGTFTSAFGDKVYFTGDGGLIPTPNPLVFNVNVQAIITGGTGHFTAAQGYFTITGTVVFPNFPPLPGDPSPVITNHYNGLIAY